MRHLFASAVFVALVSALPAHALDEAEAKAVMARAVDGYIAPAYANFHDKAEDLAEAMSALCAAPSNETFAGVEQSFGNAVEAWSRVDFIREGPVLEKNRFERVLFYPDRKSTGMKQVQALLARPDEAATDPKNLAGKSVAMQGLGALEFVLFGTGAEEVTKEKGSFRCRYGLAVARNVEAIGSELEAAWTAADGVALHWKEPSRDNPVFRDGEEAVRALIGIHVHGLEAVRDQRIRAFYQGKDGKLAPKAAVFWRSGNTIRAISANVAGLEELWKTADMGRLLPEDIRSVASSVTFDYKAASRALASLSQPTAEALADEKYRGKLDFVDLTLKDAIARINDDVGGAIGLGAGFSFADGD